MMVLLEYILVGLAGGSILIFLAKGIMAHVLQRDLDYYDDKFDRGGERND
ncbi:MAG: hypothetical protein IKI99_05325 [Firmicutes bacterium]|nr:hypothetical protein [Bacillota bacterium]